VVREQPLSLQALEVLAKLCIRREHYDKAIWTTILEQMSEQHNYNGLVKILLTVTNQKSLWGLKAYENAWQKALESKTDSFRKQHLLKWLVG